MKKGEISIRIQEVKKSDLIQIAKLFLEEFSKPPFNEKATLKDVVKSLRFFLKIGKGYAAIVEKEIVGAAIFKVEQWWEGKVIIIEDLAVKEDFKNKGIGRLLMKKIEDYAKRIKASSIVFSTRKTAKAISFYQKLGYKVEKDIIFMKKKVRR